MGLRICLRRRNRTACNIGTELMIQNRQTIARRVRAIKANQAAGKIDHA